MIRTKVIGIGSPFGSDQVGWKAIEYLQQQTAIIVSNNMQLVILDRPGPALVEHFKDTYQVILIDAIKGESEAGSITEIDVTNIESNDLSLSTHGFGVIEAIELATALDQMPPQLTILGIETSGMKEHDVPVKQLDSLLDLIIQLNS